MFLLLLYSTCEWSQRKFHNKGFVLFCSDKRRVHGTTFLKFTTRVFFFRDKQVFFSILTLRVHPYHQYHGTPSSLYYTSEIYRTQKCGISHFKLCENTIFLSNFKADNLFCSHKEPIILETSGSFAEKNMHKHQIKWILAQTDDENNKISCLDLLFDLLIGILALDIVACILCLINQIYVNV